MVLDAGNSIIKAKIARREKGEIAFPHAMKQLKESEYGKITNRAGIQNQSTDYMRINGKPFVKGTAFSYKVGYSLFGGGVFLAPDIIKS
jgi:hypothetical protein